MFRAKAVLLFAIIAFLSAASCGYAQTVPIYKDAKAPLEARVSDLFSRMTQDEKLGFLTGTGFTTQPIPRLGVPPMAMADAGEGVRGGAGSTQGPATQFPAGVVMASSWDPAAGGANVAKAASVRKRGTKAQASRSCLVRRSTFSGPRLAGAIPSISAKTPFLGG